MKLGFLNFYLGFIKKNFFYFNFVCTKILFSKIHSKHILHDNYFECQDGSFCEGFPHNLSCCNSRGGRAKCPPNRPVMCADTSCAGGKDHCCSRSAQQCYIDASGPRECGMYAEFCIRPQSKILCHHASKR